MTEAMKKQIENELAELTERLMDITQVLGHAVHLDCTIIDDDGESRPACTCFFSKKDKETGMRGVVLKVYHKDTKWDGLIDEPWDWRKKWGEEEEDNE